MRPVNVASANRVAKVASVDAPVGSGKLTALTACVSADFVRVESATSRLSVFALIKANVASVDAPEGNGKLAAETGTADALSCASVSGPDTG
jgi:hypothetical protein